MTPTAPDGPDSEPVDLASAEAVFRSAAETHRGGAHAAMVAELDRLRAELAETQAAAADTDELREEAFREIQAGHQVALDAGATVDSLQPLRNALGALNRMRNRWQSVRGDAPTGEHVSDHANHCNAAASDVSDRVDDGHAPTEPPAAGGGAECHAATFDGHGCLGRVVDGQCTEQDDHHPTPGMVPCCGPGEHDDPSAAPAVGLPVTLSSVDDVAAVCRAHGLTERRTHAWTDADDRVDVLTGPALNPGTCTVMGRTDDWMLNVGAGAPASLLVAAIEAARGGSR